MVLAGADRRRGGHANAGHNARYQAGARMARDRFVFHGCTRIPAAGRDSVPGWAARVAAATMAAPQRPWAVAGQLWYRHYLRGCPSLDSSAAVGAGDSPAGFVVRCIL